jgi:predicted Zn-dependent protease
MNWKVLTMIAAMLANAAMAEGLPDLGESSQSDLSPQMERKIGETAMRDIRQRESSYLDDAEVAGYLNDLGTRLEAGMPDVHQDFEFFALRDATLNAFAIPGGFVGVHSGLILAAQSESELAGVLGHEMAHVTQHHIARLVGQQKQAGLMSLAALAVAILAARSNSDLSQAAVATGAAAGIQTQLNFSRDFEREADRIGIQSMQSAGFDPRAMASFFERLQRFSRLYENNAPVYLRTHPLTTERIADMENRAASYPRRKATDSVAFQLVRAKLRSQAGTPEDAVADFESQLRERKFSSEGAARYGLARAYLRAKKTAPAQREVESLRGLRLSSPMVETLAAEVRVAAGDPAGALKILRQARQRHPQNKALAYGLTDTLLDTGHAQEALQSASEDVRLYPGDPRLWQLKAKAYAALGKRTQQHRALAEAYALQGQVTAAVEQLQIAQKAGDGDFYELSAVDARLREMKARQAEEAKQR